MGADDQSSSRIRSGSVSDADSILSLTSSIDARGVGSRQKSDKGGMMWESSLDMPTFDFDSSGESFMFPDSMSQSDSDFSTNKFAFPVNSSAKTRKTTKVPTQRKGKGAVSKRNTTNNRKSKTTVKSQSTKNTAKEKASSRQGTGIKKAGAGLGKSAKEEKMDAEEKRRRRLERNRESARQSRRRKKQYMELLEEKVEQLSHELNALRVEHLGKAAQVLRTKRNESLRHLNSMRSLQDTNSKDKDTEMRVRELLSTYSCNTDIRRAVLEYYFRMLNGVILPPYTRFLIWMINQGEEFFSDVGPSHRARNKLTRQKVVASTLTGEMHMEEIVPSSSNSATDVIAQAAKKAVQRINSSDNLAGMEQKKGTTNNSNGTKVKEEGNVTPVADAPRRGSNKCGTGTIWPLVSNELGLTYDQEEKMKATFVAHDTSENRNDRQTLHTVNSFLSKLGEATLMRTKAVHGLSTRMHQVLTPVQSARFLLWMEKNRGRVHECGLDHLLASGTLSPEHTKSKVAQNVASQFVNKSASELNVNEMINLLQQIITVGS